MIMKQRIRHQSHVVQSGQEIEQRVAGLGDQNFLARIAEQAKEIAVRFARACREEDLVRCHISASLGIVPNHRLTRAQNASRIRIVDKRL